LAATSVIGTPAPSSRQAEAIRTRAPRLEDAADAAALVTSATAGWLGWPAATEETILTWWRAPGFELEHDARIAVEGDEVVGYALLLPGQRWRWTYWLDLWTLVGPRETSVADALLTALEPRTAALARRVPPRATVRLRLQVEEGRRGLRDVLERRGFRIVRSAVRMITDLDGHASAPSWPAGVAIRTYRADDAQTLHGFLMDVLADTWEFVPQPFEGWVEETQRRGFDPNLWWIAERDGEIAGVMLCHVDQDDPELGWLHVIGVGRAYRGHGLGRSLVLHGLHELRQRGLQRAALGVDADNPTGARSLAERNGFRVAQRFWTYERRIRGPRHLRRLVHGARRLLRARSGR
jgi:mycothiol synthase